MGVALLVQISPCPRIFLHGVDDTRLGGPARLAVPGMNAFHVVVAVVNLEHDSAAKKLCFQFVGQQLVRGLVGLGGFVKEGPVMVSFQ